MQNTLLLGEGEAIGRCHFGGKRYEKRNEKKGEDLKENRRKSGKINAKVAGQIKGEKSAWGIKDDVSREGTKNHFGGEEVWFLDRYLDPLHRRLQPCIGRIKISTPICSFQNNIKQQNPGWSSSQIQDDTRREPCWLDASGRSY